MFFLRKISGEKTVPTKSFKIGYFITSSIPVKADYSIPLLSNTAKYNILGQRRRSEFWIGGGLSDSKHRMPKA